MLHRNIVLDSGFKSSRAHVCEWGGLQPDLCSPTHKPPTWKLDKEFCWDSDNSKLEVSDGYRALIRGLGLNDDYLLKFRFRGYRLWCCDNSKCGVEKIFKPCAEVGRLHPYASRKHVGRVISRVFERVEFMRSRGADYLIHLDLTVPKWVSEGLLTRGTVKRLRRAVHTFTSCLKKKLFPDKSSRLGGFYTVHIWATRKPLDPHLHVHLSLFNVAYSREDDTFHRFRPFLNHALVKLLWGRCLKRVGLWDSPSEKPCVYLHYSKTSDVPRTLNRLAYIHRRPTTDLNRFLASAEVGAVNPSWAKALLNYTPRSVMVGFATRLKGLGFANIHNSSAELCPNCGQPMRKGPLVKENLPDLPHYIRFGGAWVSIPPPAWGTRAESREYSVFVSFK